MATILNRDVFIQIKGTPSDIDLIAHHIETCQTQTISAAGAGYIKIKFPFRVDAVFALSDANKVLKKKLNVRGSVIVYHQYGKFLKIGNSEARIVLEAHK